MYYELNFSGMYTANLYEFYTIFYVYELRKCKFNFYPKRVPENSSTPCSGVFANTIDLNQVMLVMHPPSESCDNGECFMCFPARWVLPSYLLSCILTST